MIEAHFEHWDRLLFRDFLVLYPEVAREYGELKTRLSESNGHDRIAYTEAKTGFILGITRRAKEYFRARAS